MKNYKKYSSGKYPQSVRSFRSTSPCPFRFAISRHVRGTHYVSLHVRTVSPSIDCPYYCPHYCPLYCPSNVWVYTQASWVMWSVRSIVYYSASCSAWRSAFCSASLGTKRYAATLWTYRMVQNERMEKVPEHFEAWYYHVFTAGSSYGTVCISSYGMHMCRLCAVNVPHMYCHYEPQRRVVVRRNGLW